MVILGVLTGQNLKAKREGVPGRKAIVEGEGGGLGFCHKMGSRCLIKSLGGRSIIREEQKRKCPRQKKNPGL